MSRRKPENERASGRRRVWTWVVLGIGVVFTILAGSTAFFDWHLKGSGPLLTPRFSPDQFAHALVSNLGWLVVFLLLSTSMLPLRAVQWQRMLAKSVPFTERWHLVNIGAAVQNLLPGNLGDITRAFLLARTQGLSFVVGMGSVVVCKVLELSAMVLLAATALSLPYWGRLPELSDALRGAAWLCAALAIGVVVVSRFSQRIARRLERASRLPQVQSELTHLNAGLGAARSIRGMLIALLYSFPPSLAASLGYGIGLQAMGIPHGLFAGPIVLAIVALGQGIPGFAPGPGVYILLASWAARRLGASPEDAAAYALLTDIATGLSHWIPGIASLLIRRLRWSDLKSQSALAREAAKEAHRSPETPPRVPAEV